MELLISEGRVSLSMWRCHMTFH